MPLKIVALEFADFYGDLESCQGRLRDEHASNGDRQHSKLRPFSVNLTALLPLCQVIVSLHEKASTGGTLNRHTQAQGHVYSNTT